MTHTHQTAQDARHDGIDQIDALRDAMRDDDSCGVSGALWAPLACAATYALLAFAIWGLAR